MVDATGFMTQRVQQDLPHVPGASALRNVLGGTLKPSIDVLLLAFILGAVLWCLFTVSPQPAAAKASSPLGPPATSAAPPWSGPSGFPPPRPFGSTMRPWLGDAAKRMTDMRSVVTRRVPPPSVRRATLPARIARARSFHVPVGAVPSKTHDRTPRHAIPEPGTLPAAHDTATLGVHADQVIGQHEGGASDAHDILTLAHRDHWIVMPGDTLWDIAASHLGTRDARRIARYWPLIHRANRAEIGSDPSLI
ncbi:MAG: hypothetical protein M3290_10300, partial [Actinomycetota bacterium]|nr:hypothetical protein [Actinomycetota bacterium]